MSKSSDLRKELDQLDKDSNELNSRIRQAKEFAEQNNPPKFIISAVLQPLLDNQSELSKERISMRKQIDSYEKNFN